MKKYIWMLAIMGMIFLVPSYAVTYISECTELNTPGETYILTQDIIDSEESICINIIANNIVLDCSGHKIDGNPEFSETGIRIDRDSSEDVNITIRNCEIKEWMRAIEIYNANNVIIDGCNFSSGLNILHGNNNLVLNSAFSGYDGKIYLQDSDSNIFSNLTFTNGQYGIQFYSGSDYNIVNNSKFINCGEYGCIYLSGGCNNKIYNNFFNATTLVYFGSTCLNYWNTTKQSGTNIVGGPYIGGNFWAKPDGTGYSETCEDSDGDGICDEPYELATDNIDYLPLAQPQPPNTPPLKPTLISPPNNSEDLDTTVELVAYVEDPDGDSLTVEFYVNDELKGTTSANSGTNASITVSGLNYETKYSWYVKACDENGACNTSDIFYFRTKQKPVIRYGSVDAGGGGGYISPSATVAVKVILYPSLQEVKCYKDGKVVLDTVIEGEKVIFMDPGTYECTFSASGYKSKTITLNVERDTEIEVTLEREFKQVPTIYIDPRVLILIVLATIAYYFYKSR